MFNILSLGPQVQRRLVLALPRTHLSHLAHSSHRLSQTPLLALFLTNCIRVLASLFGKVGARSSEFVVQDIQVDVVPESIGSQDDDIVFADVCLQVGLCVACTGEVVAIVA